MQIKRQSTRFSFCYFVIPPLDGWAWEWEWDVVDAGRLASKYLPQLNANRVGRKLQSLFNTLRGSNMTVPVARNQKRK